jgi:transposase-like protein
MSAMSFAAREGIAPSTLYQWLASAKQTQTGPRMARVIRRRSVETSTPTKLERTALILEVGSVRVHVAAEFYTNTLTALLDLLEERAHTSRS